MLKEKVLDTINKNHLIEKGDYIIVGVSGGPDSTCLLHILSELQEELQFTMCVAHINHGIRKEAKIDEEYVKDLSSKYNLKCYVKEVKIEEIAKKEKLGTEEAGRKIRYEFFEEIRKKEKATKIATAHTKNDSVETTLFNLLRGSGLSGLKGITPIREDIFIRPLIDCTKEEIIEYCKEKKLEPRIDKTNFENIYTRNKIRNSLIPYLEKEFNPNIIETISRMSEILYEEDKYIQTKVEKAYKDILINETKDEIILDLKKFNNLDLVIKNRIVLYTINVLFGTSSGIQKNHIEDILKLCGNNIGNKFLIPNKKIKILVKNKKIFFSKNNNLP